MALLLLRKSPTGPMPPPPPPPPRVYATDVVTHPKYGAGTVVSAHPTMPSVHFPFAHHTAPPEARDRRVGLPVPIHELERASAGAGAPPVPKSPTSFSISLDDNPTPAKPKAPSGWGGEETHMSDGRVGPGGKPGQVPPPAPVAPDPEVPLTPRPPTQNKVPQGTQQQYEATHHTLAEHLKETSEHWGMKPHEVIDAAHKTMKHVLDRTRMVARLPGQVLPQVLEEGLRNQHATGRSGGMFDPKTRQLSEGHMFGIPMGSHHSEYPTYGYLEPKDDAEVGPYDATAQGYGDAKIVFKPHMRERSTFTVGDSLNGGLENRHLPAPLDAPHFTAADNHLSKLVYGHEDSVNKQLKRSTYWETQMHGPVTHEDIHHVEFDYEPSPKVQQALADKGIEWTSKGHHRGLYD